MYLGHVGGCGHEWKHEAALLNVKSLLCPGCGAHSPIQEFSLSPANPNVTLRLGPVTLRKGVCPECGWVQETERVLP